VGAGEHCADVNVSTAVGYDPELPERGLGPIISSMVGIEAQTRGIRLATQRVRTAFPAVVRRVSRVGSRCDMRELKTLALRTVEGDVRGHWQLSFGQEAPRSAVEGRAHAYPAGGTCPERAQQRAPTVPGQCHWADSVNAGAFGAGTSGRTALVLPAPARTLLSELKLVAAAASGECHGRIGNDSLVPRSSPFARAVGERRHIGPVDQQVRRLKRQPDGRIASRSEPFQGVSGVNDGVDSAGLETTQQSRQPTRLSHRLAAEDGHPIAGGTDRVQQCLDQRIHRQYDTSVKGMCLRDCALKAAAYRAPLDLEHAPAAGSLDHRCMPQRRNTQYGFGRRGDRGWERHTFERLGAVQFARRREQVADERQRLPCLEAFDSQIARDRVDNPDLFGHGL
jgi:hypothetical protein